MKEPTDLNLNQYDSETVAQATEVVFGANRSATDIRTREQFARELGEQFSGDRDLYEVLGYTKTPDAWDYRTKFRRLDIAERIVAKPPRDTWRERPTVTDDTDADNDTEFEDAVETIADDNDLYHYCRRADTVAGIGEYGLLLIGVADDEVDLSQPVNEGALSSPDDLAYLTPYAQYQVHDWTLGKRAGLDPTDERYTKPVEYTIDVSDPEVESSDIEDVHWSRVIHIAEDTVESDLKGTPRLQPVFNRLDDYQKVLGASAEMFWTGADRKFHFDVRDGYADLGQDDLEALDDDAQKLVHELQNYIKTAGVDVNVIGGEAPDPSGVVDQLLKAIAGAVGMPKRILTGSERGELASSQDKASWYGKIEERQSNFAEPHVLRPLLDRLRMFGILAEPQEGEYDIEWPALFELTELEQADVELTRAETLTEVAPVDDPQVFMSKQQIVQYLDEGALPDPDDLDDETREPDPVPTPPEGEPGDGDDGPPEDGEGGDSMDTPDGGDADAGDAGEAADAVDEQFDRIKAWRQQAAGAGGDD